MLRTSPVCSSSVTRGCRAGAVAATVVVGLILQHRVGGLQLLLQKVDVGPHHQRGIRFLRPVRRVHGIEEGIVALLGDLGERVHGVCRAKGMLNVHDLAEVPAAHIAAIDLADERHLLRANAI